MRAPGTFGPGEPDGRARRWCGPEEDGMKTNVSTRAALEAARRADEDAAAEERMARADELAGQAWKLTPAQRAAHRVAGREHAASAAAHRRAAALHRLEAAVGEHGVV
jgi:hypothetical protein